MGCGVSWQQAVKPKQVKVVSCKRSKGQGKDYVPYSGRSAACECEQKSAEAVVVDGVATIQGG